MLLHTASSASCNDKNSDTWYKSNGFVRISNAGDIFFSLVCVYVVSYDSQTILAAKTKHEVTDDLCALELVY